MADLKTQIVVGADATGAHAGITGVKRSLADLGPAAAKAGKDAGAGVSGIGDAAASAQAKVDAATRGMINSIQRQIATLEAGGRGTADYYRAIAAQKGINADALAPHLATLEALTAKSTMAGAATTKLAADLAKPEISAKQAAAALRGLPAQMTDVVVSLQAGQAPLTVLLQQGGQLKDMFGGVGPAARAVGGAVLGLLNPFTIAAAAAAVLALAYKQGSDEATAYQRALVMTGNVSGQTAGQIAMMAKALKSAETTEHDAAAALAALTETGAVAGRDLQRLAGVAVAAQRVTGAAVEDTVKTFAELGRNPVEASRKLNEAQNYLSASTYAAIKAFDAQGKSAEAASLAQNAYADAMSTRTQTLRDNLGTLESAWLGVKEAAKGTWDAMLDIGRTGTVDEQIAALQLKIADAAGRKGRVGDMGLLGQLLGSLSDDQIRAAQEQLVRLMKIKDRNETEAQLKATEAATNKAGMAASDYFDKLRAGEKTTANLNKALAEYDRHLEAARKAGLAIPSPEQQTADRSAIRDKYTDKDAAAARLAAALDAIKKASDMTVQAYATNETKLEQIRSLGLLSDEQYYAAKRSIIEQDGAAQDKAFQAQITRLRQEKLAGADKLTNDKAIADLEAQQAAQRVANGVKLFQVDMQAAAATRAKRAELLAYTQALRDSADEQERSQQRDLSGMTIGNTARSMRSGLDQITDTYARKRRDLANQRAVSEEKGTWNTDELAKYDAQLQALDSAEQSATESYKRYWDERAQVLSDWTSGATEALANYRDQAADAFSMARDAASDAFQGMEDALVSLVTTGKADFKSLADSIIADIVRIQIRQALTGATGGTNYLGLIMGAVSASSGAGTVTGGSGITLDGVSASTGTSGSMYELAGRLAGGGSTMPNKAYQVNERGPELLTVGGRDYLMMGDKAGYVTPNGGSGGVSLQSSPTIYIDSRSDASQVARLVAQGVRQGNESLLKQLKASGRI